MKKFRLVAKKEWIMILILVISFIIPLSAQTGKQFQFRKDHTFKIAQFTDIHWNNNSANCAKTIETIQQVLATEKPDIAIITGDLVTEDPAKEGWLAVSKIFIDAKIPWAVTLGNHDGEHGISRDNIYKMLESLPYFVGSKGSEMYGSGNYTIPVMASNKKKVVSVIYCMDSNDYPKDKKIGHYDWIHFDQIDWYRKTSDKFTLSNNKMPIPSVMFFHIPLIEFNDIIGKKTTIGVKNEEVASAEINSGLFASMVEKGDIMGVFVGHDHDDNYIGIDHDICLAYGQVTGADAYGKLERGSRIIELHEGKFSFDSWIRTKSGISLKYNYPLLQK